MRTSAVPCIAAFASVALAPSFRPPCLAATPLLGNSVASTGAPATLYDVDPATGAATNPRSLGVNSVVGITFGPGGTLYGLMTFAGTFPNSLVRIDPVTGNTTVVGATGLDNVFEGDIAFNPATGLLYGLTDTAGAADRRNLFTMNPATGAATVVGHIAGVSDPSALAFSPAGVLYMIDNRNGGPPDRLYRLDPSTAVTTAGVDLSSPLGSVSGMAFDPADGTLFLADGSTGGSDSLYTVDPSTGSMTRIGGTGPLAPDGLGGLAFVPEPGPPATFLAAAALALARRRRRTPADRPG